jgi:hypothetical protein
MDRVTEGQRLQTGVEHTEQTATRGVSLGTNPIYRWVGVAAIGTALLFIILSVLYGFSPAPASLSGSIDGATYRIDSDDARMPLPGGCFTVRWTVENVKGVFLSDDATVGTGERDLCGENAHLAFITQTDRTYEFHLARDIAVFNPALTGVLLGATGLALLGVWLWRAFSRAALLAGLLFLLALHPRLPTPAFPITTDEAGGWLIRSERFLDALTQGDLAGTLQAHHPGVLTNWLGAAGHWLVAATGETGADAVIARAIIVTPLALVNALAIPLLYLLLLRLLNPAAALLAGIFAALCPLLVAHGQVLHIDGLATTFMTLSFLTGLIGLRLDREPLRREGLPHGGLTVGWWVLSAVCAGLAMLAKMTAGFLLPLLGLVALSVCWRPARAWRSLPILPVLLYAVVMALTWVALYPAVWVNPGGVVNSFLRGVDSATSPHEFGNFFMGQPVEDPGALFYPVALALRLTPWALLGAGIGAAVAVRNRRDREGQVLLLSLLYAAAFLVFMTVQAKKFDRYILPLFPLILLLAGAGWTWAGAWLAARLPLLQRRTARFAVWSGTAALLLAQVTAQQPYTFAYYNPLFGGGAAARALIFTGWGEGIEQAAAYINVHPMGCEGTIITRYPEIVEHYLTCVESLYEFERPLNPDNPSPLYALVYVNQLQRQIAPGMLAWLAEREPVFTARIGGVDYVYLYDLAAEPFEVVAAANTRIR